MYTFFNITDKRIEKYIEKYIIQETRYSNKEIVWLCIGTSKIVGDSFGPFVGSAITSRVPNVYGTLKHNVNGKNLNQYIEYIQKKHKNPYIVVLDSALGDKECINNIVVGKCGIVPGKALGKKFNTIGELYIGAVVEQAQSDNFKQLTNVKQQNVIQMSNKVIKAILGIYCFNDFKFGYTNNI